MGSLATLAPQKDFTFGVGLPNKSTEGAYASFSTTSHLAWWSSLLVGTYLAIGFFVWGRTMISDEIWALLYAARPFNEQLQAIRLDLVHPPAIYLIQRGWLHTFGFTENAAKALPLVINIPTLVLFTWLACQVTPHWRLASFLFSSIYLHVGSVPNLVRMYGLVMLGTVAAIILWEQWRRRLRTRQLILWTVIMVLLIYTHYFGLLLLGAFVAISLCYGARQWAFIAAAGITGIASLPWFLYVFPLYLTQGLQPNLVWVDQSPYRAMAKLPFFFLTEIPAGLNPFGAAPWFQIVGLQAALIVVAGLIHLAFFGLAWRTIRTRWLASRQGDNTARWFWTTALVVVVPVALLYCFSIAIIPALDARILIGVLPCYWLLLVLLGQFGGIAGRALLYGVVVPWVLVSICVGLAQNLAPSPVREGTLLVSREFRKTDLILCSGEPGVGPQVYWEWTRRLQHSGSIEILFPKAKAWVSLLPQKDLKDLDLDAVDRIWFFYSKAKAVDQMTAFLGARGFALDMLNTRTSGLVAFARTKPDQSHDGTANDYSKV